MDNYDYLWSIYRLAIKHGNRESSASSMIFQLDHKQRGYQWIELIHVESYNRLWLWLWLWLLLFLLFYHYSH